ncbi:sulfatase-like hydrolase/transferase [Coraliomargarita parva]|uniref:sulfatase-like hydrolase/transferase n=1 Tax=Coraliomargarita parva TaxID=3014050 RepID=UPI0022B418FB|nr:sulfatase-like hydrolase/transferase [Coraliomargarita parva]
MNANTPNFVFIMTDTQGTNVIESYCGQAMRTPNIDKLAAEGVRFDRGYTTCPVCSPARSAIFTGLFPSKAGPMTNNLSLYENRWHMGQFFQQAGFHTAYIGKWHLDGHDYFDTGNCPDGWDDNYWYDGRRYLNDLSDAEITLWREKLKSPKDLREHDIRPEFTWAHRISDKAIDFLDHHDPEKPFLLVASYDEPHGPFTCPHEYAEAFEAFDYEIGPGALDDLSNKPSHHRDWAGGENKNTHTKKRQAMYFGCNSFVDTEIGRLLDAIQANCGDNTVVIFTSDHGEMLNAHGIVGKGPAMYDEITRIPYIIRSPKQAGRGRKVTTPVSHVDFLPTMLDMAGIPTPDILDGSSVKELVETDTEHPDRHVMLEFQRHSICHDSWGGFVPIRCIVQDHWKLAINLMSTDELYDLEKDPAELHNLIDSPEHAGIREQLIDNLLKRMNTTRDPFRGIYWEQRPWRVKRTLSWKGLYRMKPDDGHSPTPLVYQTGRPATEVGVHSNSKPGRH